MVVITSTPRGERNVIMSKRYIGLIVCLLCVVLLLCACGLRKSSEVETTAPAPTVTVVTPTPAQEIIVTAEPVEATPAPTPVPVVTPAPTPVPTPVPTATPTAAPGGASYVEITSPSAGDKVVVFCIGNTLKKLDKWFN